MAIKDEQQAWKSFPKHFRTGRAVNNKDLQADQARHQRLEDTGYFEWLKKQTGEVLNFANAWLAGYDKALFDEKGKNDPKE